MIIQLENISKAFGKQTVLKDISLNIPENETIAISGPSGSGKTTMLNLIAGLDIPDSGSIIFKKKDISKMNRTEQAAFRNKNIGFIFQMHYLLPQCTVLENVLMPTITIKKKSEKEKKHQRALQLLERVSMTANMNKYPGQLSGGECQRTAFVRALINEPALILADEPTGSIDPEMSEKLSDLLIELNKENNTTLVVVTHSQELAAKMTKIYNLKNNTLTTI